jgi:hypothetical protein
MDFVPLRGSLWMAFLVYFRTRRQFKNRLMLNIKKLESGLISNTIDLLSNLVILIVTACSLVLLPLLVLPRGKSYALFHFDCYLVGALVGGLCRLRKFLSWVRRSKKTD